MPLYEARPDGLVPVAITRFEDEGWRERGDIQRLLRDRIDSLEDGLMVLAEEFNAWNDSNRRVDLLCLDRNANLVVVELKRTDDGGHAELQALRYAAMLSEMTFEQAVATLARHRNPASPNAEEARNDILRFLDWSAPQEENFAKDTRILLVAADFGKELTTTVLWLRDRKIDIRCVRLRPYRLDNGQLLLDIQQIIPLPETAEFVTRIQEKKAAEREERGEREQLLDAFLSQLATRALSKTRLHEGRSPSIHLGELSRPIGKPGLSFTYVISAERSRVELMLQRDDAQNLLYRLKEEEAAIHAAFDQPLIWHAKEGVRQCRVFYEVPGGYRSPQADWPAIQDRLIDAMIRLEAALRPHIEKLRV